MVARHHYLRITQPLQAITSWTSDGNPVVCGPGSPDAAIHGFSLATPAQEAIAFSGETVAF